MKNKHQQFLTVITNWPKAFSTLEFLIIFIGILVSVFLYQQTTQISATAESARSFDIDTRRLILSISMADIQFNELIEGNTELDINKDVYDELDIADSLCENIDTGGPSGEFVPTIIPTDEPGFTSDSEPGPVSVCLQLQSLRNLMVHRWNDHMLGQPDDQQENYETIYMQVLNSMQRYDGVADPHLQKAEQGSRRTAIETSVTIAAIFLLISFVVWRTRKTRNFQTLQLEAEIEQRKKLNSELDSERNLVNTLIDNLPDAVFAKDQEGHFLVVNPAAVRVMGTIHKEEVLGKDESNFQPVEISEKIIAEDQKILKEGEMLLNHQEIMIDLNTGNPRWRQTTKVPLKDRFGQIIGLVGISRDITKQKETEEALQNANLQLKSGIATLEQSSQENEHLSEMVDLLQACPNTEEACIVIADQMDKFFPKDSGVLYLFHESRNMLDQVACWGRVLPDAGIFKPDDCWGLRRGRMHVVEKDSPEFNKIDQSHSLVCPHIKSTGSAAYLCVPLVAQGEALGLLHLRHQFDNTIDETDPIAVEWYNHAKRQRVHTIVDSLSLALANLKLRSTLREQSIRDPLTGLFNRRYMEETLEREIIRAMRNNDLVGAIMLDIDHFKIFNDTFGHQAGDALLASLGKFFQSHIRAEDVACRYGGEEFLLLLPGANLKKTLQRAQELVEKAHYLNVSFQGQSLGNITLSAGVSVFPQHGSSSELFIQAADQALYQAKMDGRDQVKTA